jgi:hypothetical protein
MVLLFLCLQVPWRFKSPTRFPEVKQVLTLVQDAEISTFRNELVVRKPLVVSISQRREKLRLHNLVQNLTSSNPGLKMVSSNASPGWTIRFCFLFLLGDDRGLLKEGVKAYLMTPTSSLNLPTFFCLHIYSVWIEHYLMMAVPWKPPTSTTLRTRTISHDERF